MADDSGPQATAPRRFPADRRAYVRGHVSLALLGSIIGAAILLLIGNPHAWVAPVAAVGAIAVRGFYLASEELAVVWEIRDACLASSDGRSVPLDRIERVRRLGTAVQVVTRSGDKYLLKHQADPESVRARILAAAPGART